jgi:hypothetical protein
MPEPLLSDKEILTHRVWEALDFLRPKPSIGVAALVVRTVWEEGWRKPYVIETENVLAALPESTVIRDCMNDVFELREGLWCSFDTKPLTSHQMRKYLPVLVLWTKEAP